VRQPPDPDLITAVPVPDSGEPVPTAAGSRASRRAAALLFAGVVLVALNLRAAVTSLGALLEEVRQALDMSPTVAGVVTMLPTLSFAAFGIAAPWLARRVAPARILVGAMLVLAAGQALRALTGSIAVFLICSALALSGIAVANVLLPALVKQYFPDRVGLATGVYSMSLIFGTSTAAAAAVPIAEVAGSWRVGLGAWAVLAVIAAVPWLPTALRREVPGGRTGGSAADGDRANRIRPARTGLGWAMAIYFGTQALNGYAIMGWLAQLFRDAGFAAAHAGLLLASVTAIAIPLAFLIPNLAARAPDLRIFVLGLAAVTATAYAGLAVAPASLALLWVLLLAAGQTAFPFTLTLIGLRARTPQGTVALSAFTQSGGYLIAGLGPLLVGVLYGWTGGWFAPLVFLIVVVTAQMIAGLFIARPRFIEDA
jgi:MFS transporter, CP family, cyanate transporter